MHFRHRPVAVPAHAHPVVQRLFVEMNAQRCTAADLSERSGVNKNTIKDWRTRTTPKLDSIDAALNVLGLEIVVRPKR